MPILIKKIEASILSLFGGPGDGDFTAPVQLITNVIGEAGVEDYIKLSKYEAFTQDFSSVISGEFCSETTTSFGLGTCTTYEDLNIDYTL